MRGLINTSQIGVSLLITYSAACLAVSRFWACAKAAKLNLANTHQFIATPQHLPSACPIPQSWTNPKPHSRSPTVEFCIPILVYPSQNTPTPSHLLGPTLCISSFPFWSNQANTSRTTHFHAITSDSIPSVPAAGCLLHP